MRLGNQQQNAFGELNMYTSNFINKNYNSIVTIVFYVHPSCYNSAWQEFSQTLPNTLILRSSRLQINLKDHKLALL